MLSLSCTIFLRGKNLKCENSKFAKFGIILFSRVCCISLIVFVVGLMTNIYLTRTRVHLLSARMSCDARAVACGDQLLFIASSGRGNAFNWRRAEQCASGTVLTSRNVSQVY